MKADQQIIRHLKDKDLFTDGGHTARIRFARGQTPPSSIGPCSGVRVEEHGTNSPMNEQIRWVPEHINAGAWATGFQGRPVGHLAQPIWGTPLPIWINDETRVNALHRLH